MSGRQPRSLILIRGAYGTRFKTQRITKDRQSEHGEVECAYSIFTAEDGRKYVQLETFGSKERKIPGKTSQAIQLNEASAGDLKRIIEETFPRLR